MKIVVPATSSNLGCGFDSVGMAVNLYLEVEIIKRSQKWIIHHSLGKGIASDESNLVVKTALSLLPHLPPHELKMTSSIPLERGLGSSASAIVAGIEMACLLGHLSLSPEEKLKIACRLEGHPDNAAPAILGGLVVSSYHNEDLSYCRIHLPTCAIVAYIPNYKISTAMARKILPAQLPYPDAVRASSIANVMLCALSTGNLNTAGKMMELDMFHETYREPLFPDLAKVRTLAKNYGAYATYLSGAGSTILILIENGKEERLMQALNDQKEHDTQIVKLELDGLGTRVES